MVPVASSIVPDDPLRGTLSLRGRLLALAVALACLAALALGAFLRPDPRGIGTHRQLGLSACQFQARTGIPCPTCGVTTSFAHLAHGQVILSLYVQPLGTVLGAACILAFWVALSMAITGQPSPRRLRGFFSTRLLIAAMALVMLAWTWKILIRVAGVDGSG